jgi:hypothetical protein
LARAAKSLAPPAKNGAVRARIIRASGHTNPKEGPMARIPVVAIYVVLLLPATALAHGAGAPALHVDPSLKDCSVSFSPELTQDAYRRFVREFGSVSAFKQGSPPTTLGQRRVSVGLEWFSFGVEDTSAAWNDTFKHPDADHDLGSTQSLPKVTLRVGVTDDLDVGAFYTRNPDANYGWLGLEAKYAILRQGGEMPVALAVRGAYTKTLYVTDMDMHALTADVTVGRTFWQVVTPYLGLGADAVLARETSSAVELRTETAFVPHLTAGLDVRFWRIALGAEAQVSALVSYQAQVAFLF